MITKLFSLALVLTAMLGPTNSDIWTIATLGQDVQDMTSEELREAEARAGELLNEE